MQVFLGDEITIFKNETTVTGRVAGVKLRDTDKQLERIYIQELPSPFWMRDGWLIVDEIDEGETEDD